MTDIVEGFLEHHGIKGMHWGSRKANASTSSSSPRAAKAKTAKPTSADIHAARHRTALKEADLGNKEIAVYAAKTKQGQAAAQKVFDKAEKKFYNDPDVALGDTYTKGEKVANALSLGFTVTAIAGSIALAATAHR